jgi:hypothetical protein
MRVLRVIGRENALSGETRGCCKCRARFAESAVFSRARCLAPTPCDSAAAGNIAEGHEKGPAALTEATRAAYFFVVFFAAFLFFDGLRRQAARAALIAGEGGGE